MTTEVPLADAMQALPLWTEVQTLRHVVLALYDQVQYLRLAVNEEPLPPLPLQAIGLTHKPEEVTHE